MILRPVGLSLRWHFTKLSQTTKLPTIYNLPNPGKVHFQSFRPLRGIVSRTLLLLPRLVAGLAVSCSVLTAIPASIISYFHLQDCMFVTNPTKPATSAQSCILHMKISISLYYFHYIRSCHNFLSISPLPRKRISHKYI